MSWEYDYGIAYSKPTNGNRIKVTMNKFRDTVYIHIREYMMDGDTGRFFPTKSGYALLGDEVDSVIELLEKASAQLGEIYKSSRRQLEFDFDSREIKEE